MCKERQWSIWYNQGRRQKFVKPFWWPFVLHALHLTSPEPSHPDYTLVTHVLCFLDIHPIWSASASTFSQWVFASAEARIIIPFSNCFPQLQYGTGHPISHCFLFIHYILWPGFAWYPPNPLHNLTPEGFLLLQFTISFLLFPNF